MNLLQILVQVSQRPQIIQKTNINELDDWIQLIQCRDKVLHQLRTEGHCGRTSFIRNSIELVLKEILFRDIFISLKYGMSKFLVIFSNLPYFTCTVSGTSVLSKC